MTAEIWKHRSEFNHTHIQIEWNRLLHEYRTPTLLLPLLMIFYSVYFLHNSEFSCVEKKLFRRTQIENKFSTMIDLRIVVLKVSNCLLEMFLISKLCKFNRTF
jgi:hypothetical protein